MDYAIKTLDQLRPILQGFRKTAGLTQAAMASHLGVTQQTYAQLEANPASVSVERLFKVLRVLNVGLTLTQVGSVQGKASAATMIAPTVTPHKVRAMKIDTPKRRSAPLALELRATDLEVGPRSSTSTAGKKTFVHVGVPTKAGKTRIAPKVGVIKKRENW